MARSYTAFVSLFSALLAVAGSAYGAQPPDVVTTDPNGNTAMGSNALASLLFGLNNTAAGQQTLFSDVNGSYNTGTGWQTLYLNTYGSYNSAFGSNALWGNGGGNYNSAIGYAALYMTSGAINPAGNTGSGNTASGALALYSNSGGSNNTASGMRALYTNGTGASNAAMGSDALYSNTTGNDNTAVGSSTMYYNLTASENTAVGHNALGTNQAGSNNVAIGSNAGYYVRGGRYNIEIGNVGAANDAGTIRIGTSSQQGSAYIAGIANSHVAGSAVYITATGQLGVLASSDRYKTGVASMGSSSEKLRELRSVTFHLKTNAKAGVQYGLIAEEVAKVFPELVIRGDKGQIEGVRYEELTPMLLNEIQRQQAQLRDMQQQLAELQEFRRSMQGRAANQ